VLLTIAVVALLFPLGFIAVAWIARLATMRLGLDPWNVLVWFGLAETPVDELAARRAAPVRGSVAHVPDPQTG
jgi:hypothetical protein